MAQKKGFQIDRRVAIAMDALPAGQKTTLKQVLHDQDRFMKYAAAPGRTQRISAKHPIYKVKVGSSGLRLIYSQLADGVIIMDIMHKKTMDQFGSKKTKASSTKKDVTHAAKKAAAVKVNKS